MGVASIHLHADAAVAAKRDLAAEARQLGVKVSAAEIIGLLAVRRIDVAGLSMGSGGRRQRERERRAQQICAHEYPRLKRPPQREAEALAPSAMRQPKTQLRISFAAPRGVAAPRWRIRVRRTRAHARSARSRSRKITSPRERQQVLETQHDLSRVRRLDAAHVVLSDMMKAMRAEHPDDGGISSSYDVGEFACGAALC
jgi:hypothetical protein